MDRSFASAVRDSARLVRRDCEGAKNVPSDAKPTTLGESAWFVARFFKAIEEFG